MKTLIFDTEGNGGKNEQVCQLSYICVDGDKVSGSNFYFAVDSMSDHAFAVHGLSKYRLHELSGGKGFLQQISEFSDDMFTADIFVGHNVASDIRRMRIEFSRCDATFPQISTFCTMKHYNNALHLRSRTGHRKPPKLSELCSFLGVKEKDVISECQRIFSCEDSRIHDARYDATATYLCVLEAQRRGDVKGVF